MLVSGPTASSGAARQDAPATEFGMVVSTPELVIRSCASPACDGLGVIQLGESMTVTGPAENGYLPVRANQIDGFVWSLFVATPSAGTPVLRQGSPGCDRIALVFNLGQGTFDDPFSWDMVNFLVAEDVAATMFARAWWASYYPAWAYELDQDGFVVGIHGEDGLSLRDRTTEAAIATIIDTKVRLEEAIGKPVDPVFTPAPGATDQDVLSMVALAGFLPVIPGVNAGDGHGSSLSSESIAANILEGAEDGAIIELHLDTPTGVSATAAALPGVVAELRSRGFTFVTIPDLARPCDDA
jgi:peptidoglycan/xylan/chitin deacetylase (PgdA/CDA1 family)